MGLRRFLGAVGRPPEPATLDLASLGIARHGLSWAEENPTSQARDSTDGILADLGLSGDRLHPFAPFLTAAGGRARVLLRLIEIPDDELRGLRAAVEQGRLLCSPRLVTYPTYPLLIANFNVYDDPADPYRIEGVRSITTPDVQDFLAQVLDDAEGLLHLYHGPDGDPVATGSFALRMPPYRGTRFPYEPTAQDRLKLWEVVTSAAQHLRSVAGDELDYQRASDLYLEQYEVGGALRDPK